MFNHSAILAEWFKGTDSKDDDALVFGKLIHAGRCPAQTNITSNWVLICRAGVEFIPLVAETLGGLAEDTIHITRLHYVQQTFLPPCCYCPVVGEFHHLDA